jgi:hypothetical protein
MGAALFNLAIGLIAIVLGFRGYTFLGTNSSELLIGVGVIIAGLGGYQLLRLKRGR